MTDKRSFGEQVIVLSEADNVATALVDMAAGEYPLGEAAGGGTVRLAECIRAGFKLAIRPIAKGEAVVKYGHVIGRATEDIQPGQCVHVHNIASAV